MFQKIFAAWTSVALVLGVVAMAQSAHPVMAQDNCFTSKIYFGKQKEGSSTTTFCEAHGVDVFGVEQAKENCTDSKKVYREELGAKLKCTSSQTGQGEFGNFNK